MIEPSEHVGNALGWHDEEVAPESEEGDDRSVKTGCFEWLRQSKEKPVPSPRQSCGESSVVDYHEYLATA